MLYFIISVVAGTIIFLIAGFIVAPIYFVIRDFIRLFLYFCLRIEVLTRDEKIKMGIIKIKGPKSISTVRVDVVSNCILSKDNFPNIDKYFSGYKETKTEVVEQNQELTVPQRENTSPFSGMTYKKQVKIVNDLLEKKSHGKLTLEEETLLEVLGDPDNLESTRKHERFRKQVNNY